MAKKKKTLPKNFDELIRAKDIDQLKSVFDTCEWDARGGYGKATALSFYGISEELVRWLIAQGADLEATDSYARTALHKHAGLRGGKIEVFLELGANIHAADTYGATPLHCAAGNGFNVAAVQQLLKAGADLEAIDMYGRTPLESALVHANNIDIVNLAAISNAFFAAGQTVSAKMKEAVIRRGEDFEFHRENFNKDMLPETDKALNELYKIYDVPPVKKRLMHDGVSPIRVQATSWEKQYEELWELLIPSGGPAKTVQGEVVRIAGRVRDEIYRNGGANWDTDYKKMLDAFYLHLSSGNALPENDLHQASAIIAAIRKNRDGETEELNFLCELATKWTLQNPEPVLLPQVAYDR